MNTSAPLIGLIRDTLSNEVIPECRVYLTEFRSGIRTIVAETISDHKGIFSFDSYSPHQEILFSHSDYTWHDPVGRSSTPYYLTPYVEAKIHFMHNPNYSERFIWGDFEEIPRKIMGTNSQEISVPVYRQLTIYYRRKNMQNQIDTLHYSYWIHEQNQEFWLP
ncbi:MAG: hypothetical protein LPK45_10500 [Bacteroidota bacterium]|nr:hypothetical protein [Bacteroidota bacterium]MDX5431528.1 hypothetical protein [Bacteroidota bacterium]MDX5470249.1 hypothetical protein [Bacteroidota bacterium]